MATILKHCVYHADDGTTYRVTVRRLNEADLLAVWGFGPDDASRPPRPPWLKMRRVGLQRYGGSQTRQTTVGNKTCQVWASGPGIRYDLADADGQVGDWFTTGYFNEVIRKHG